MNVFRGHDANLPTQLWIAGRYVQSASLLIAPFLLGRKLRISSVFIAFSAITTGSWGHFFGRVPGLFR